MWDHVGPFGTMWHRVGLCGPCGTVCYSAETVWDRVWAMWDSVGPCGTMWDHVGPCGTMWDHVGPCGDRVCRVVWREASPVVRPATRVAVNAKSKHYTVPSPITSCPLQNTQTGLPS